MLNPPKESLSYLKLDTLFDYQNIRTDGEEVSFSDKDILEIYTWKRDLFNEAFKVFREIEIYFISKFNTNASELYKLIYSADQIQHHIWYHNQINWVEELFIYIFKYDSHIVSPEDKNTILEAFKSAKELKQREVDQDASKLMVKTIKENPELFKIASHHVIAQKELGKFSPYINGFFQDRSKLLNENKIVGKNYPSREKKYIYETAFNLDLFELNVDNPSKEFSIFRSYRNKTAHHNNEIPVQQLLSLTSFLKTFSLKLSKSLYYYLEDAGNWREIDNLTSDTTLPKSLLKVVDAYAVPVGQPKKDTLDGPILELYKFTNIYIRKSVSNRYLPRYISFWGSKKIHKIIPEILRIFKDVNFVEVSEFSDTNSPSKRVEVIRLGRKYDIKLFNFNEIDKELLAYLEVSLLLSFSRKGTTLATGWENTLHGKNGNVYCSDIYLLAPYTTYSKDKLKDILGEDIFNNHVTSIEKYLSSSFSNKNDSLHNYLVTGSFSKKNRFLTIDDEIIFEHRSREKQLPKGPVYATSILLHNAKQPYDFFISGSRFKFLNGIMD